MKPNPLDIPEAELQAAFATEIFTLPRVALVLTPTGREDDALALSPEMVWILIGQLHLALRHPENKGKPREKTLALLDWIRLVLVPPGSAREKIFEMGADPQFDR